MVDCLLVHVGFTDRRSNIYSDRPRLIMLNELLAGGMLLPFMRYGEVFVTVF